MRPALFMAIALLLVSHSAVSASLSITSQPEQPYSTSTQPYSLTSILSLTNLSCEEGSQYRLRANIPVWYSQLSLSDINAHTKQDENTFVAVKCAIDNRLVSCYAYEDGTPLLGLNNIYVSFSLETGTGGNPIREEQWSADIECEFGLEKNIETLAATLSFASPSIEFSIPGGGQASGTMEIEVNELEGIPHYIRFAFEHPETTIPEQADSIRHNGWKASLDLEALPEGPLTIYAYPCDNKMNCGLPIEKGVEVVHVEEPPETEPEEPTEPAGEKASETGEVPPEEPAEPGEVPDSGNKAPQIATLSINLDEIFDGNEVRFRAEVIDENPQALTYSWNFGDGTASDEKEPTHTYSLGNTESVEVDISLTVSDGEKETASEMTVTILPLPAAASPPEGNREEEPPPGETEPPAESEKPLFQFYFTDILAGAALAVLAVLAFFAYQNRERVLTALKKTKEKLSGAGKKIASSISALAAKIKLPKPKEKLPETEQANLGKYAELRTETEISSRLDTGISGSEQEEIKRLVFLLKGKSRRYSREEITTVLLGEGYSERVVEKVVNILFRRPG